MDQDVGDKAAAARSPCVGADRSRAMGKVLARGGPWLKEIRVTPPPHRGTIDRGRERWGI